MADAHQSLELSRTAPTSGFIHDGVSVTPEPLLYIGKLQFVQAEAESLFHRLTGSRPPPPRTMIETGNLQVAWLAPAEWLLMGLEAVVLDLLRRADHDAGEAGLALELTHGRAAFALTGLAARDRLAGVTPLELSDRSFAIGAVARAPLGETGMFVMRLNDLDSSPCYRIIVDQTMAGYAVRMLAGPTNPKVDATS